MEVNPEVPEPTADSATRDAVLEHRPWVRGAARRISDSMADDLAQELWLAVHGATASRSPRGWLRQAMWHLFLRHRIRDEARRRRERVAARDEAQPPVLEELIEAEARVLVGAEVERLEEPYRSVVRARYYDGSSAADIARDRRVPAGTVRWQLKTGLDRLRERCARSGDSSGSPAGARTERTTVPAPHREARGQEQDSRSAGRRSAPALLPVFSVLSRSPDRRIPQIEAPPPGALDGGSLGGFAAGLTGAARLIPLLTAGPGRAAAGLLLALALGPRPGDPIGPGLPTSSSEFPSTRDHAAANKIARDVPHEDARRPELTLRPRIPQRDASLELDAVRWLTLRDRAGAPIPHRVLDIVHGEQLLRRMSDRDGRVHVRGLSPSSVLLPEGSAAHHGSDVRQLDPERGELVLDLRPAPTLRVVDATGRAVPRAAVWLDGVCLGATDAHGRLRDRLLLDGQRLRVQKPGWSMVEQELDGALPLRVESGMMEVLLAPAPAD